MIDPEVTQCLRFNDDDTVLCEGGEFERFECGNVAIHFWNGDPRCATHSPVDNIYVPCTRCGVKPAPRPQNIEEDPVCRDCAEELLHRSTETAGQMCRKMSGAEKYVDPTQPSYAPFGSQGNPPTLGVDWNEQDLHPRP